MNKALDDYVDTMIDDVDDGEDFNAGFENIGDEQNNSQGFDEQQQQNHQQLQNQEDDNAFDTQLRQEIEQNRQQLNGDAKNNQQPKQGDQQQQRPQVRPLGDGSFVNQRGDIVDEQGHVIAQRGFARRMYETNQRNNVRLEEQDRIIHQLRTQSAENNAIQTAANQYGLDTNDLVQAVDLAGRVKRGGIVDVAKELVARAVAAGHNVTEILGTEVGDSVDMRALRQMIGEVTTPLQQQQQEQQRQRQIVETAQAKYNDFISRHEFAQVHENDIAKLAEAQGIDATRAYYALREFCIQHRLDFSMPIEPQIAARNRQQQSGQRNQQQRQPNQQQRQRRPLPNGGNSANMQTAVAEAPHDASWAEIIKSSI